MANKGTKKLQSRKSIKKQLSPRLAVNHNELALTA